MNERVLKKQIVVLGKFILI